MPVKQNPEDNKDIKLTDSSTRPHRGLNVNVSDSVCTSLSFILFTILSSKTLHKPSACSVQQQHLLCAPLPHSTHQQHPQTFSLLSTCTTYFRAIFFFFLECTHTKQNTYFLTFTSKIVHIFLFWIIYFYFETNQCLPKMSQLLFYVRPDMNKNKYRITALF